MVHTKEVDGDDDDDDGDDDVDYDDGGNSFIPPFPQLYSTM